VVTLRTIDNLIADHPFFAGLGSDFITFIAGCGRNRYIEEGDYLAHEGEEANAFFLIRRGKISVETNVPGRGPVVLETLGIGDIAGWSWILPPYKGAFDVVAREAASFIEINGLCLRGKCEADPVLGYVVLKRFAGMMSERLRDTRLRLLDLYGNDRKRS
jgi:CRP/FNR family transcriptional regulator, cyclic AMP receptor protein